MKVNKKSFIYKMVNDFTPMQPADNLCHFFWQVVVAPLWLLFLTVFASFILFLMSLPFFYAFVGVDSGFITAGVFIDVFILFIVLKEARKGNLPLYDFLYIVIFEVPEKKPNIFTEYIKAVHKKICPFIEYK